MAKKSEIIGEYILTINDDNSVNVSMIPDNTKKELCTIAEENNIPHDDNLTTHQLGALILKELGKKGENSLTLSEYEIEKEPDGRINLLKTYGNTKEGLRQISEQVGFEYNKEWNTQQFGRNLMNFIVKRDEEVATTPGNFVVNSTTTGGDLNKQFQSLYGGYLKIYNGRSVANDDEKLVDMGAKTGEFSCRASRTVGSFVEAIKETFGLKVKVWTADEWVTVLDGITLSKVRDLPKQATKAVLKAYESYKRDNKEAQELSEQEIQVVVDKDPQSQLSNKNAIYFVINSEPREIEEDDEECGEEWFVAYRALKNGEYIYGVFRFDPHELEDELGLSLQDIEVFDMNYDYDRISNYPNNKNIYLPEWLFEFYTSPESDIALRCPDSDSEPIRAAIYSCLHKKNIDWPFDEKILCILINKDGKELATWVASH